MMIAPKSSVMAKAARKTFSDTGTLLPNRASAPSAKAMSVGHWNPNAPLRSGSSIEQKVKESGHGHATDGGKNRQGCVF